MKRLTGPLVILIMVIGLAPGQSTGQINRTNKQPTGQKFRPADSGKVTGSGTNGRISKWVSASGSSVLGDAAIFEDTFGKVGIGTASPTSTLTVAGMIQTTLGGIKFPDGTIQSSAFSPGQLVSSLNGLKGDLTLEHDQTIKGNGSPGSPLGLAVPLIFSGDLNNGNGVITVTNIAAGSPAIFATGGVANASISGGAGLVSHGGSGSNFSSGGIGLVSVGGTGVTSLGGTGGTLMGGASTARSGGDGLFAIGGLGVGTSHRGGRGIVAIPGVGAGGALAGLAGEFLGDVEISGSLSKGGGSFKIDHPLDPENKYLYHSFVESPDMKNIYDGNATTDENGEATVVMPDWFEALNRDFRYQLTVIGTFAQAIISEKIKDSHFRIKTNAPNIEVSWQVTGIRQDAYANKNRIKVEVKKPELERGSYLHPEAFGKPRESGLAWRQNPETSQPLNQQIEAAQKAKQERP